MAYSPVCCFLTLRLLYGPLFPSLLPIPNPHTCLLTPSHVTCFGALSTVEDLERNDGSAERPYFMSSTLKKLLNKTNKKVAES